MGGSIPRQGDTRQQVLRELREWKCPQGAGARPAASLGSLVGFGGRFETKTSLQAKSVQRVSFFPEKRGWQGQGRRLNEYQHASGSYRPSNHMAFQHFFLLGYFGAFFGAYFVELNIFHCPYNGWSKAVVM